MEGLEWLDDREESRPQPPPTLSREQAGELFNSPHLILLTSHPGCKANRERLLGRMPQALRSLEKAVRQYHDESPKSKVGAAYEWNECLSAAELLLTYCRGVIATLQEEEGE